MIVNPVSIDSAWSGAAPQRAWIFLLQEMPGKALNVQVKAAAEYTGAIDMPALLKHRPSGNFDWRKQPNKNPTPTALSIHVREDLYIGFMLTNQMGVAFAETPFTGGSADAAKYWFQPTRVSDTTAYLMVKGAGFAAGDCCHPFNIHLIATGTFADGTPYSTPLILDPDGRFPDGGGPPGHG